MSGNVCALDEFAEGSVLVGSFESLGYGRSKEAGRRNDSHTAAFVLEQHLGHRTYSESLRAQLVAHPELAVRRVSVEYSDPSVPAWLPEKLRATLAGRNEVRRGLHKASAEVHVFNTQVPAVLGGRVARSRPYVVITDVTPAQYDRMAAGYGHPTGERWPTRMLKHRINERVFAEATWCVGWSAWAARSIVEDYGVDPSRVVVIPPGVDMKLWSAPERGAGTEADRGFRLLFVGGEFVRKGGEVLLEAFKALSPRAELYLVTKTPVRACERVHVIDDLGPNDPRLMDLYRTSDVFVLPSLAETFGIAAFEASAMWMPVVASSSGGLAEIVVDGQTGFNVDPGDVDGLTAVLTRLESDPEMCRSLGSNARMHATEHFDATANASALFDLVRSASTR